MGVFFHILSTGGGSGGSRITRYIAERDRDPGREGHGSRRLFSKDQDDLSYHRADRILDPDYGHPEKDDLIHFSVMIKEEEFDKLGADEKEKQERFREAVREAMKGVATELNVEELTWVGGIHRNSENPHAHIVMNKEAPERGTGWLRRIGRLPRALLPHKEIENGKEILVNGRIGDRFVAALEEQKRLYLKSQDKQPELTPAERWELLARKHQKGREGSERAAVAGDSDRARGANRGCAVDETVRGSSMSIEHSQILSSWNAHEQTPENRWLDFRVTLGKRLDLEYRLAFAEVWHDRAVKHGDSYRFEVVDQSTAEERKISELDVRRRAAARAARLGGADHTVRNEAIDADIAQHRETLQQLSSARETKIAALGKDVGSLRGNLAKIEQRLTSRYEMPTEKDLTPILSRHTLSELQGQAVKLNLPDRVSELEKLRVSLAREHKAPTRTDDEASTLAAQVNVARADFMAKGVLLEYFEASAHLTSYDVAGDRWSLAALDKQIARRQDDAKLVPQRAARLELRSLLRFNYSAGARERAAAEIDHLTYVRGEIVRQIEQRRQPLVADHDLARQMVNVIDNAYSSEQRSRTRIGSTMPEPRYERYQVNSLEASAETLRDPKLLRQVHDWEKNASKNDREISWEGRAVAREITSGIAVEETKERLQHFLKSKKVAALNIGNHQTATLLDAERHSLMEYLGRAILESREQRDHRQLVKSAARTHRYRLRSDFERTSEYQEAARELALEAKGRAPSFSDKEKINLEIYAERQNDVAEREKYLELARGETHSQEREISTSKSR